MIMTNTQDERQAALDRLMPLQKSDFRAIFDAMDGLPVTIRTIDPPLHEFLPNEEDIIRELESVKSSEELDEDQKQEESDRLRNMLERLEQLREQNPMLGHRGCRLGITYPEITEMQAKAIFLAAADLIKKKKVVIPEVMIPMVGHKEELSNQKEIIDRVAHQVLRRHKIEMKYLVGTMIEVPRAALIADQIAQDAEFFSFGTNDLTQMSMAFSRDDAGKFLRHYYEKGILTKDPFITLDQEGVGQLVILATEKGRGVREDLKVGICGEHGGDPRSVEFCHRIGLDYVSCSPYRVPIARLAAAQAAILEMREAGKPETEKRKTTIRRPVEAKAGKTAKAKAKTAKAPAAKAGKKKPAKAAAKAGATKKKKAASGKKKK
jgi:pyruvate,orthophosphate dikinase